MPRASDNAGTSLSMPGVSGPAATSLSMPGVSGPTATSLSMPGASDNAATSLSMPGGVGPYIYICIFLYIYIFIYLSIFACSYFLEYAGSERCDPQVRFVCVGNPKVHGKISSYFHVRSQQGASAVPGGHWPTKTPPGRGENVPAVGNVCDMLNPTSRALVYLANSRCILVLLDQLMDSRVECVHRYQVRGDSWLISLLKDSKAIQTH